MQRVDIASKLAIPNALPKDCFDVPLIDPDLTADPGWRASSPRSLRFS